MKTSILNGVERAIDVEECNVFALDLDDRASSGRKLLDVPDLHIVCHKSGRLPVG